MRKQAHGIEVLLRKASVDPEFRDLLLRRRSLAAEQIGLELTEAEEQVLATVPAHTLQLMIGMIEVPEAHRPVFKGRVAAAMLALVVGAGVLSGCEVRTLGIRPTDVPDEDQPEATGTQDPDTDPGPTRGIRADPVQPKEDSGDER